MNLILCTYMHFLDHLNSGPPQTGPNMRLVIPISQSSSQSLYCSGSWGGAEISRQAASTSPGNLLPMHHSLAPAQDLLNQNLWGLRPTSLGEWCLQVWELLLHCSRYQTVLYPQSLQVALKARRKNCRSWQPKFLTVKSSCLPDHTALSSSSQQLLSLRQCLKRSQ